MWSPKSGLVSTVGDQWPVKLGWQLRPALNKICQASLARSWWTEVNRLFSVTTSVQCSVIDWNPACGFKGVLGILLLEDSEWKTSSLWRGFGINELCVWQRQCWRGKGLSKEKQRGSLHECKGNRLLPFGKHINSFPLPVPCSVIKGAINQIVS